MPVSTRPFIAARIEEVFDRFSERIWRALGWRERVICYTGYGTSAGVRVLGRVVLMPRRARSGLRRVTREFVRRRGFRNFFTAPCVRAQVTVTVGRRVIHTTADRGGYVDLRVRDHGLEPGWHEATIRSAGSKPATAPVQVVADDQRFGIISDIDDTVITTWLPRLLIAFWNSFIRDESARQAIPGMARLYTELLGDHPGAPLLYLSTGAWNTHAFLSRFLKRHAYPPGAMLLTDWGPTNTGWFRSGPNHKRESLLQLTRDFPGISWLLVGDDGQHDLAIYSEFAQLAPDNVRAIAIRQLSPTEQVLSHGTPTLLPEVVDGPAVDVPLVRAPDGRGLLTQLRKLPEPR